MLSVFLPSDTSYIYLCDALDILRSLAIAYLLFTGCLELALLYTKLDGDLLESILFLDIKSSIFVCFLLPIISGHTLIYFLALVN